MNILNDHDWDKLESEFKAGSPFPSICIDNFLDKDFADSLAAAYPDYSQAKDIGDEFRSVNENLKVQITSPSLFPEPVSKLCEVLGSKDFLEKLVKMTGIENLSWDPSFTGGGMHLTGTSGILDVHIDFNHEERLNLYRRLNILIYLNPAWESDWGGEVELWDKDVKSCEHSFAPIHNRCVLFATSDYSFHGVAAVTSPEGVTRNSFAAYYYTEDAGDNVGKEYGGSHSTIFRARPNEKGKKYLSMPLHKLKVESQNYTQKLKSMIKKMLGRS